MSAHGAGGLSTPVARGVAIGRGFDSGWEKMASIAFDLGADDSSMPQHARVGLALLDPCFERVADLVGDRGVVELGDDVQLRAKIFRDPNCQGLHLAVLT